MDLCLYCSKPTTATFAYIYAYSIIVSHFPCNVIKPVDVEKTAFRDLMLGESLAGCQCIEQYRRRHSIV
ncbi:hypothetical protein UPYG_G00069400 [Umbra pygmaea]|uniref:Uncharacterized protein n=1 Tax=Umbra pygmaea TaxID=75934 RepID=A0ABD0XBG8_UMBPY